jgi:predicted small lipoprotein YifL
MRGVAIATVLLLAGCGQKGELPKQSNAAIEPAVQNNVQTAQNTAEQNAAASDESGDARAALPSADAALRFVGKWATDQASCAAKPWVFTADTLKAADGPHCSFYKVTASPGGYDIAAECPTKEPVHTDLIKLRFAESAQAMLVESNAISPMGLVYCGK